MLPAATADDRVVNSSLPESPTLAVPIWLATIVTVFFLRSFLLEVIIIADAPSEIGEQSKSFRESAIYGLLMTVSIVI